MPEGLAIVAAPLHGPDGLGTGALGAETGTAATAAGTATAALMPADGLGPPDEYVATKPLPSTELSAENSTYMLPPVDVTEAGMLPPLNDPSKLPLLLEPS